MEVEGELLKGAEANGYANDVWTLQRVAEVIERVSGVSYHPATCGPSCATNCGGVGSDRHAGPMSATTRLSTSG